MLLPTMTWSCGLALVILAGLFSGPASGQSSPDGQGGRCSEPDNLLELYRELREQQITDVSVLQDPSPPDVFRSSTATITRLSNNHHSRSRLIAGTHSDVCQCESRDELNHDPTRIPRMMPQSSCRRHTSRRLSRRRPRGWRTQCEEIYRNERVKKRNGCVNGVYQYVDGWESVPVGCRCHVYPIVVAARD